MIGWLLTDLVDGRNDRMEPSVDLGDLENMSFLIVDLGISIKRERACFYAFIIQCLPELSYLSVITFQAAED